MRIVPPISHGSYVRCPFISDMKPQWVESLNLVPLLVSEVSHIWLYFCRPQLTCSIFQVLVARTCLIFYINQVLVLQKHLWANVPVFD